MTELSIATGDGFARVTQQGDRWNVKMALNGSGVQCLTRDPLHPEVFYAGSYGKGIFKSSDHGGHWENVDFPQPNVFSLAVSPVDGTLYAGCEPSMLFRSRDGGQSWQELAALRSIPSAPTWSFPPRPWTSHVRWIAPDAQDPARLFVGIELGGVMRSLDGGRTWEDRKPEGQHDAHTLRTHPLAPDRVYEAAGGGYAESHDGGASWRRDDTGLNHRYTWGLAVDPADPETIVISAAHGPGPAHNSGAAESHLYRRSGGGAWQEVREGLPEPRGTRTMVLAANAAEPHVFYAATRDGAVYRSADAGSNWERLPLSWPEGYRVGNVEGLFVTEV